MWGEQAASWRCAARGVTSLWPREEAPVVRRVRRTGLMRVSTVGTEDSSRICRQRPDTTPDRRVRSRHRPPPHSMTDSPRPSGATTAFKRPREAETANEPSKHQASSPTTVRSRGGDGRSGPTPCSVPSAPRRCQTHKRSQGRYAFLCKGAIGEISMSRFLFTP